MPVADALKIAGRICDALEYLLGQNVVHRDLKPENVMLCDDGSIRLMDFGIAKAAGLRRLTFSGFSASLGTPDYMAPEQVKGKRGDARTDIYSLGVMLYEMVTGALPFEGSEGMGQGGPPLRPPGPSVHGADATHGRLSTRGTRLVYTNIPTMFPVHRGSQIMSRTNTFLSMLAATAMALPLVSCGGSAHDSLELYYLVTTNSKIQYWQAAAAGFSQAANDLKVRYDVAGPDSYDPQAERQEFRKVVQQKKPTGILVSAADAELLKPEIDAAVAQGIPVITIDSDSPASKRLMFIGTDNYEAGRRGGAVLARQLQGKGNVVVFTMPEQANLRQRWHGYEDALKTSPGIKVV